MRGGRVFTLLVVTGAVAAVAFVAVDHYGARVTFADLPGDADVQLVGRFTPRQVSGLAALPQAAAVECGTTLYGVTVVTAHAVIASTTVLTAASRPQLRWSAVRAGTYPVADGQLLLDERTAARHGLHVGDKVTLSRGVHVVNATVVGLAARPAEHSVGDSEPVALLPAGSVSALDGGAPCGSVTVELKRRRDASTFTRAAQSLVTPQPAVIYDESLRGHV